MSNRAAIYPTKFVGIDLDGTEQDATYGLRVADDHGGTYSNLFDEHDIVGKSPAEIVAMAEDIDEAAKTIIDFARENGDGIEIADVFYTWVELEEGPTPA